jgi:hypothetical protein
MGPHTKPHAARPTKITQKRKKKKKKARGRLLFAALALGQHNPLALPSKYGWTGQQSGSGFSDLASSILHYNWF